MEYTSHYIPFQTNFVMFTMTSGIVMTYILLACLLAQLYHCCFKNLNRYVARHTDPADQRIQRQYPASWEKESDFKPASSFTMILLCWFACKMIQTYSITFILNSCINEAGIYDRYQSETQKVCDMMVAVPSICKMFCHFIILLLLCTLASGFRTMHATLSKSVKHKGLLYALVLVISLHMCIFYLPEEWMSPQKTIQIEIICIVVIAITFVRFVETCLLDQEKVLDEYLTYLQDIYFQIIN